MASPRVFSGWMGKLAQRSRLRPRRRPTFRIHPDWLEGRTLLTTPPGPIVIPGGFSLAVVAQGGPLANVHLDGLTVDPNSGNLYVASEPDQPDPQFGSFSGFDLWQVTPAGAISHVGSYPISHFEITQLVWGPGGQIYSADTNGNVDAINPTTGATSLYSASGISLDRYGMQFDQGGSLILMPSNLPDAFFRVTPGSGATFLGSYQSDNGDYGDSFGIQPNGDYVLYPGSFDGPAGHSLVTQLNTASHADGTDFPIQHLTSTYLDTKAPATPAQAKGGLRIPVGYSIGAIDPGTGDVYATSANEGTGATRITFTPGNGGPTATSSIFVDQIGNNVLPAIGRTGGLSRGVTGLAFGPSTNGSGGNSLFFIDDFTDSIYEVRGTAPTAGLKSSAPGNTSVFGQSVTFTATVSANGAPASGSVGFFDGNTQVASQSLDGNGVATYTTSTLPGGTHAIKAKYTGAQGTSNSPAVVQTVTPAPTSFSQLVSASVTYGTPLVTLSGTITAGALVPGGLVGVTVGSITQLSPIDPATGNFSVDFTSAALGASGSPYTITYSYAGNASFQQASDQSQTLAVSKALLTVSADPQSRQYGQPNPAFTATITGFVNGDGASAVMGSPDLSSAADQTTGVGAYPIGAGQGTLSAANYDFTFQSSTLTITPAPLTITADDHSKLYGASMPALTVSYDGFVNGDDPTSLTTPVSISTDATAASHVGGYLIEVADAQSPNYTITLVPGTLTVTPAPLVITADNQGKTYGAPVPDLTISYSGFVNGDGPDNLSAAPIASTAATDASPVGSYDISVSGASDPDYAISDADGTFTITPAHLTVQANDATKTYGDPNPPFSATISGFVLGQTLDTSGVAGSADLSSTATATSPAGTYSIVAAPGTLSAANYDFTSFLPGTLTITRAQPAFSGLGDATVVVGSLGVTVSGKLTDGGLIPSGGVTVSLGGQSQAATLNTDGTFSANLSLQDQGAGSFTITYHYAGDANFVPSDATSNLTLSYATSILTNLSRARQGGSTLVIQLQVDDGDGQNISSASLPVVAVGIAPLNDPNDLMAPTSPGNSNPNQQFRFSGGTYAYNLKLVDPQGNRLSAGTYVFYYRVGTEAVLHSLQFQVK